MPDMKFLIKNGHADDVMVKCPDCGWDGHIRQAMIEVDAVWSPEFCPNCFGTRLREPDLIKSDKCNGGRFTITMSIIGYIAATAAMILAFML